MAAVSVVSAVTMAASGGGGVHHRQHTSRRLLSSRVTFGGSGEGRAHLRTPATTVNRVGDVHRRRGDALKVNAYDERDNDGPAIKVDISMADVKKGKRIGKGSFGDVFEGSYKGQSVILKEGKTTGPGRRFFESEAAINRRLKNSAGVASFLGKGREGEEKRGPRASSPQALLCV